MPYLGEAAALATAILWAFTSIFFTGASRLIGALKVNKIRLAMAAAIYALVLTVRTGSPFHLAVGREAVMWLCLSSLIGLVIGDSLLFKAFTLIGPRLTTLVFASSPIMATVIAWTFLDEKLALLDLVGIAVTIGGIAWVVAERSDKDVSRTLIVDHHDRGSFGLGVLLALGGSLCQAAGLVTSKHGMLGTGQIIHPLEASFVRILFAVSTLWLLAAARGQVQETLRATRHRRAMLLTFGGTIVGPFLGIWMSLVAVSLVEAGVAATLNATVPVMVIPLVVLFHREKVSLRAVVGAFVAVGGVALLFLH